MNILEQTEALKDLPDQALIKEMQMPTGMAPPVFITAELKRRQRMRDDFKRREAQDMPTVAEEVVMAAGMPQGGIADAAKAMAPKSSIAQNTGMNEMMPAAPTRAPQRMAEGGIVRMAKGGKTPVVYNGMGYFLFADGDVQDALGRPVSDEVSQAVKSSVSAGPEIPEFDPNDMMPSFDVGESRTLDSPQRPEGDDSPSIADVSPSLEDVRGRELGPPQPEQFSSMNMVPSFDVGELSTVADPEVIAASEQLPTRPRSLEPIYSETAYPMFSESTYEQGLESTPDTGEMQRPALPTIGSDPRISGNTEVGILPRGFQDLRSPQEVDLDLVGGQTTRDEALRALDERYDAAIAKAGSYDDLSPKERMGFAAERSMVSPDRVLVGNDRTPEEVARVTESLLPPQAPSESSDSPSKMEQMMQSRSVADNQGRPMGEAAAALAAMTGQASGRDPSDLSAMSIEDTITTLDPTQGYPMPQGPNEQSDIGLTEALTGSTFMDLAGSGMDALKAGQQPNLSAAKEAYDDLQMARSIREAEEGSLGGVAPTSAEAAKDISDAETQAALTESVIDMTAPTGTPTLGGGDPALEQGIASALQAASTGNVITTSTKDGGGGGGGIVPTGGAATGLEARIAQMLSDREADRETDKYMALAQAGLALMASKNPTLGGAIGEAGLAGVGALRKAKSQYDADILGLMGLEEKARSSRLSRQAALAKANRPKTMTGTERVGLLREAGDLREELIKLNADIAREGTLGDFGQVTPFTPEQLAEKVAQARLLESEINKYKGMAYPQLANVQTVNP